MGMKKIPKRLYKYRSFSDRTLETILADELYFADPSTFNDPLDTKPCLETDIDADALASIFRQLVEKRITSEMLAAAKIYRTRGPRTLEHITDHSQKRAEQLIKSIRYNATNPDYQFKDPERHLFGQSVEEELLRRYNKGIVSLSERSDCPLMWSHYGDQHNGLCLGYSVPEGKVENVHKVKYGGSRLIKASLVHAMLEGDKNARRKVDEAVLANKAADWRYEREWRLVGPRGLQDSPLEFEEVVIGMRCSRWVRYAIVTALKGRSREIKFFEIQEGHGRIDRLTT